MLATALSPYDVTKPHLVEDKGTNRFEYHYIKLILYYILWFAIQLI